MSTVEVLSSSPKLEITVVSDDLEGFRKAFEELTPVLECFGDRKHLMIINLVVSLSLSHRL